MKRALWWIKRDFRLLDNEALDRALKKADAVLPLYVFERDYISQPDISPMHIWAWLQALKDLKINCQSAQGDVLVSKGYILKILTNLHQEWRFSAIYSHEETGNYWTYQRDISVAQWCNDHNVEWVEIPHNGVIRGMKTRTQRQPVIQKRLFESPIIPAPSKLKFPLNFKALCAQRPLPHLNTLCDITKYPHIKWEALQDVSESAAQETLHSFLTSRGQWYSGGISSPNKAMKCGSRLSVHLAWGTVSLRYVFQQTYRRATDTQFFNALSDTSRWSKSLHSFASRLHWHCHFIQRLESQPKMEFNALNKAYSALEYENASHKFQAWQEGVTGFPMIDACMRCLNATGFINFRMRSMLVSFACFGLHLDWRLIHPHLAQVFLDYEPGIHLSQLQMQAGIVGINTIRVYSPNKQIIDQDPKCLFIKKWIPELREFSPEQILCYESIILGDYPSPIVDFKVNSKIMKDRIFKIRKSISGKRESKKVLKKHGSRKQFPKKKFQDDNQLKLF